MPVAEMEVQEMPRDPALGEAPATFAATFKRARVASGMTQAEAAVDLGVSVNTIESWEQGVREPGTFLTKQQADRFVDKWDTPDASPRWAKYFAECQRCHKTDSPHDRGGVCERCRVEARQARGVPMGKHAHKTPTVPLEAIEPVEGIEVGSTVAIGGEIRVVVPEGSEDFAIEVASSVPANDLDFGGDWTDRGYTALEPQPEEPTIRRCPEGHNLDLYGKVWADGRERCGECKREADRRRRANKAGSN